MAVYLAWLPDPDQTDAVMAAPGPWRDVLEAGPGLLVLESDDTLSRVYHEVKWLLPDGCALLVAPLAERPKARGVTRGTASWLRDRLPLPAKRSARS